MELKISLLHGNIEEELKMKQPDVFKLRDKDHFLCRPERVYMC